MSAAATEARFVLPPGSEATAPPEARGLARDEVRMAVVTEERTHHRQARELPMWLEPGDLLVVNTSATLPSALEVERHGCTWGLHVSAELDDGAWVVELRRPGGAGPGLPEPGEVLRLPGGVRLRIATPHPAGQTRLWRATTLPIADRVAYLRRHGSPIRYPYLHGVWPIEDLQNVYAAVPGSAEMPSAGRPLTREVLVDLMSAGVVVAPLVLHTGVASQESHEPPQPEWLSVPESTARLVERHPRGRRAGRRGGHHGGPGPRDRRLRRRRGVGVRRLDVAGALVSAAGAGGERAAHRAARARGQPPRPARGGGRADRWSTGPTPTSPRRTRRTTCGTSSGTRCCCCRERLRPRGRPDRAPG